MILLVNIVLRTGAAVQTLSLILAVLAVLFALFLMTVKTKNRTGSLLLAFYFVLMAIDFSAYFDDMFEIPPNIEIFRNDFSSFLSRPLIYLYVLSVIYSDFRLKPVHLLHSLSFILVTILMLPWYFSDFESQMNFRMFSLDKPVGKFIMHFSHVHTQAYIIAIFLELHKYRKLLLDNFSNANPKNYKWLFQMTIMLQLFFLFVFVKNMFRQYSDEYYNIDIARILLIVFTILFLGWLLLKALHAPEIFRGIKSNLKLKGGISLEEKEKPELIEMAQVLKRYMIEEQPFLDSDLTLSDLADKLDKPIRELSVIINLKFGQHFYDFVNSYRVEKAQELLKTTTQKELTTSEIMYDVGFNSKSSFYTAFKKHTGTTPTKYRERTQ